MLVSQTWERYIIGTHTYTNILGNSSDAVVLYESDLGKVLLNVVSIYLKHKQPKFNFSKIKMSYPRELDLFRFSKMSGTDLANLVSQNI